ncbi:glycosyltransferase [Mangrovibrevibacter kandeliae]|uniref:glycosyltransferase n=1 Tax=Mangrovibrevibacter kandeliae TaxID=2968473 RepID=UPI0021191EAD|nr:glycosyltransferase [Aurantimonas sp. CSK15Z-1]MCQ8781839.1 glycosyltransferase [Aurantimonas sp. CSK15Z-1]
MTHFALICPPFFSHVRLFEALAEELARRGHRLTFVLNDGAERLVQSPATTVRGVGAAAGARTVAAVARHAENPSGPFGILRTVADTAAMTDALCRDGAEVLRGIGAEAVIGDQMEPAAGLLARHLGLPLISLAAALPIDPEPALPPPFLDWPYDPSERGLRRNRGGERVARLLLARQRRTIAAWAERFGLPAMDSLADCLSPVLRIAQTVPGFDLPRQNPGPLHAVGPIRSGGRQTRLDLPLDPARPFVFASLGTLQGHRLALFRAIATACRRRGAQLLVAHCGGLDARQAEAVGATWVTDFAPQRAVLARADLCITHGGLNTVMDALEFGVPSLVIPLAFDQPGVAARVVHHGVGTALPRWRATARAIEAHLAALLGDEGYRRRATAIGAEIAVAGGVHRAADLVEQATVGRARVEGSARLAS